MLRHHPITALFTYLTVRLVLSLKNKILNDATMAMGRNPAAGRNPNEHGLWPKLRIFPSNLDVCGPWERLKFLPLHVSGMVEFFFAHRTILPWFLRDACQNEHRFSPRKTSYFTLDWPDV